MGSFQRDGWVAGAGVMGCSTGATGEHPGSGPRECAASSFARNRRVSGNGLGSTPFSASQGTTSPNALAGVVERAAVEAATGFKKESTLGGPRSHRPRGHRYPDNSIPPALHSVCSWLRQVSGRCPFQLSFHRNNQQTILPHP